jgi:hypothetical protein
MYIGVSLVWLCRFRPIKSQVDGTIAVPVGAVRCHVAALSSRSNDHGSEDGAVGFSRKRAGKDGRPRYTAYYRDLKDRECSAGTFGSKKCADKAWQRAEAKIAEGR